MRPGRVALIVGLAACVGASATSSMSVSPPIDVAALTARADVIAMGRVSDSVDAGVEPLDVAGTVITVPVRIGVLHVTRWLKGQESPGTVRLRLVSSPVLAYDFVPLNATRLFFLKRLGGRFSFVDHVHPTVPAVEGADVIGSTDVVRVLDMLGAVLAARQTSVGDKVESIAALVSLKAVDAVGRLKAGLEDADEVVRLTAAAALISKKDNSGLPLIERALMPAGRTPSAAETAMAGRLRASIALYLSNSAAIPFLGRLAAADDVGSRRAAVEALANCDDAAVVPLLARGLLEDDLDIQFAAVRGLARLAGDRENSSSVDAFPARRASLVDYWTAWARARRIIR